MEKTKIGVKFVNVPQCRSNWCIIFSSRGQD